MTVSSILANGAASAATAAAAKNTTTAASAGSAAATASATDSFTNPGSALNQTDFLQLLVAQIQYQDPMNPQSDTDMAAQLAQFTSLQQATQSSASLAMIQANTLVGSTVTVQVDATDTASGLVTGVVLNNGTPQVTVGGENYNLSQITSITPTTAGSSGGSASGSNGGSTSSTTPNPQ